MPDNLRCQYDILLAEQASSPKDFEPWLGSPEWDVCSGDLGKYLTAPMHCYFLGIVKKFLERLIAWVNAKRWNDQFSEQTNGLLELLMNLGLSFLEIEPLFNGLPGQAWISKKYLGLARVLPWFVSILSSCPDPKIYVKPDLPVTTWTGKQYKAFLQAHGIPVTGMLAPELKQKLKASVKEAELKGKPMVPLQKVGPFKDLLSTVCCPGTFSSSLGAYGWIYEPGQDCSNWFAREDLLFVFCQIYQSPGWCDSD
jgi:hypothetical protein